MPSQVDLNRASIFRSFHLDFLCADLATPITSDRSFSNLRYARRLIHPGNCSPAPFPVGFNRPIISQSHLLEFLRANPATPIAQDHLFSSLHAHAPPLKKRPCAPSMPAWITRLFLKASSLSYLVQIRPHRSLMTVRFRNSTHHLSCWTSDDLAKNRKKSLDCLTRAQWHGYWHCLIGPQQEHCMLAYDLIMTHTCIHNFSFLCIFSIYYI